MIDVRRIARDFVVSHLGADEDFFNTAWDFISSNYERLSLASVSYFDLKRISMPLGIAGDEEEKRLFAVVIFVDGTKHLSITDKKQDLIRALQTISKKSQAHERLTEEILNRLKKFKPEVEKPKNLEYEEKVDLENENYLYNLLGVEIDYVNKEPRVYFKLFPKDSKDKKPKTQDILPQFSKSEKNFALLTRLAVAIKVDEKIGIGAEGGWLYINGSNKDRGNPEKLEELPFGKFPDALNKKIHYDSERKLLIFKGIMSKEEKEELLRLSQDTLYQKAVEELFQKSYGEVHEGHSLYLKSQELAKFREDLGGYDIFNLSKEEKEKLIRTKIGLNKVRLAIPKDNIHIEIKNLKDFESRFTKVKGEDYPKGVKKIHRLIQDAIESYKKFSSKSSTHSNLSHQKL